ncbi:MAG: type II secretion system protein M [Idiomarina sp.]
MSKAITKLTEQLTTPIKNLWQAHGQSHWQGLNAREQLLVKSGLIVALIGILYFAIWAPLSNAVSQAELRVQGQQQLLTWVRDKTAQYQALTGGASQLSGQQVQGSLTQRFTQLAQQQQISVNRTQPQGNDLVVVMDEVDFAKLLRLLHQLQTQAGVQIQQLDLAEANTQGQVRVRRLQLSEAAL